MTYRWLGRPEVAREVGRLRPLARNSFFRLSERLAEDPRAADVAAVPFEDDEDPYDTWCAPFGPGGLFVYRIIDWGDELVLDPVEVMPPNPAD